MSTFNSPTDVVAGTLAKSSDINNLDAATAAAFALLPTNAAINAGTVNFAVDTGAADAYLVALPMTATSYGDGLSVIMRPLAANTGACTINVDSLGVKSIKTEANTTPAANDIIAGVPVELRYSTATGYFHIIKNSASSASAAAASAVAAAASAAAAAVSAAAASASQSAAAASAAAALVSQSAASASASAASASESAASSSASAASGSASAASASESAASSSASSASSSASTATTQASAASVSAAAALVSQNAAAASYDSFDDRYLGAKASDPSLDNDGDALIAGAMYFNTTSSLMKVYSGSAWLTIGASEVAGDGIDVTLLAGQVTISVNLKANGGLVIEATELALNLGATSITGTLAVGDGGTGATSFTANGILYGNTASALQVTASGTEGQILRAGASGVPAFTTATYPATTTVNQILYSSSANVIGGITTGNSGILVTSGAGVPSISTDIPTAVTIGTAYIYRVGGTDVAVGDGGTGVGTFTLNGILYGNAATSVLVTAAGTAAGQLLTCGATPFVPAWTTATYPGTTTINQILYSSATNTVVGLATGNNGILVTNGSGVPSIATDIPTAVTIGAAYIYRVAGTDIPVTDGGTGVSTLTDHGVLVGSGTDAVTALVVGTNGQVLVGSTGADPVFATITDGEGIDTTLGAGTLTIACEDTSETNKGVVELATNAEALTGTDTARAITPDDLHYVLDNSGTRFTNLLSNTQWMAMSGSTLENVSANLTVNGTFDADTNWEKQAGWTITGGYALATNVSGGNSIYETVPAIAIAGKLYKLTFTISSYSDGNITAYQNSTAISPAIAANGTYSYVFECITNGAQLQFWGNASLDCHLDDVSLYEVTPGYVAADSVAPDGMTKTSTLDLHQYWNAGSDNTYGYGIYLLKATKGAATAEYLNFGTTINYRDCQGKSVALGCWVYSTTASDNVKLSIYDGVSEIALSSGYCPANTLTWMEITGTVAANASTLTPRVLFDGASSDVAYISEPIMIKGSSIGQGNYQPIPGEEILCQSNIALTGYTATASAADATINLEAASSGMIGKGVRAVIVKAYGKDSAAGDGVGFDVQSASGVEDGISIDTQVNNIRVQQQGIVMCDGNGDIYFDHRGSGASALTVDIKVIGIRP